jgi:hypothetical protein
MKVDVVATEIVTYKFTKEERDYLIKMGLWGYINARLLDNERIEVE